MYRITRVIGNNFVCSAEEDGQEIIIRGLGIGFRKKKGDIIPPASIEKIYSIQSENTKNKLLELVKDVPTEHVAVCTEIIEYAKECLGKMLSENIYITLTDHISFAIERKFKNLEYKNALLWEIKNFYPNEFSIGQHAMDMIEEKLGVRLSEDEAGFVALHIVNAELDTNMSDMIKITEMIQVVLKTVRNYYGIVLDERSLDYGRFITHLKFLGQRIARKEPLKGDDDQLLEILRERYPRDYTCAQRICAYLEKQFRCELSEDEMVFLTVHLRRVAGAKE